MLPTIITNEQLRFYIHLCFQRHISYFHDRNKNNAIKQNNSDCQKQFEVKSSQTCLQPTIDGPTTEFDYMGVLKDSNRIFFMDRYAEKKIID